MKVDKCYEKQKRKGNLFEDTPRCWGKKKLGYSYGRKKKCLGCKYYVFNCGPTPTHKSLKPIQGSGY